MKHKKKGLSSPRPSYFRSLIIYLHSYLRERKAAILKLFDVVGLRPQAGTKSKAKKYNQKLEDAIDDVARRKAGKTKKEVVGDGEEIEVDSAEELSNNDLSLIYQK